MILNRRLLRLLVVEEVRLYRRKRWETFAFSAKSVAAEWESFTKRKNNHSVGPSH